MITNACPYCGDIYASWCDHDTGGGLCDDCRREGVAQVLIDGEWILMDKIEQEHCSRNNWSREALDELGLLKEVRRG